jgi:hypothetical protein
LDLNGGPIVPSTDFDFDSFFFNNDAGGDDGNVMDYTADSASTAFLDEVPSPAHSAKAVSPMVGLRGLSPEVSTTGAAAAGAGGSRKRKSDVSELDHHHLHPGNGGGALGLGGMSGVRPSVLLQPDVGAAVSSILHEDVESSGVGGSKAKRRKEK